VDKKPTHLYLVDDDGEYRQSLVRLLRSAGYFTEAFPSAQSFLDSVPVDYKTGVLILDLRMPGMDGFALHDRLRGYRSELKVIFITADAQPGDRDRAIRSGAIGFLQKPFQEESLFELIREAMKEPEEQ